MSHLIISIDDLNRIIDESKSEYKDELQTYTSLDPLQKKVIEMHVSMALATLAGKAVNNSVYVKNKKVVA